MIELVKILNNPEEHYPGNFDTPQRANALLTGLCQDAANEIAKLQYEVDAIPAIKEERDALAAELTRLKASIALDKMAENARELGLSYDNAPKPWFGLTDEDIEQGHKESWVYKQAFESAVWWAEKKLKEKNHDH
jgi:hypothetical protein